MEISQVSVFLKQDPTLNVYRFYLTLNEMSMTNTRVIQYVLKPDELHLLYINLGKVGVIYVTFQPFSFIRHLFANLFTHGWAVTIA